MKKLLGMVGLAALLALALILLREQRDPTLKTESELRQFTGHSHYFKVPLFVSTWRSGKKNKASQKIFQGIRARLDRTWDQKNQAVLQILSALPREGKTECALGLAEAFVDAGWKTLLVDFNFENPQLHKKMPLSSKHPNSWNSSIRNRVSRSTNSMKTTVFLCCRCYPIPGTKNRASPCVDNKSANCWTN